MTIIVKIRDGVRTWHYDFTMRSKRYRDWLLPESQMTKRQANAALKSIRAAILLKVQTHLLPVKHASIKQVFDDYKTYLQEHRPETYKNQKGFFTNYKFFHDCADHKRVIEYQKKRKGEGVSGATINRELEMARAAFNRAIKKLNWKEANPFIDFDHYHEENRTRFLSPQELVNLLMAAKHLSTINKQVRTKQPYLPV